MDNHAASVHCGPGDVWSAGFTSWCGRRWWKCCLFHKAIHKAGMCTAQSCNWMATVLFKTSLCFKSICALMTALGTIFGVWNAFSSRVYDLLWFISSYSLMCVQHHYISLHCSHFPTIFLAYGSVKSANFIRIWWWNRHPDKKRMPMKIEKKNNKSTRQN